MHNLPLRCNSWNDLMKIVCIVSKVILWQYAGPEAHIYIIIIAVNNTCRSLYHTLFSFISVIQNNDCYVEYIPCSTHYKNKKDTVFYNNNYKYANYLDMAFILSLAWTRVVSPTVWKENMNIVFVWQQHPFHSSYFLMYIADYDTVTHICF